MYIPLYIDTYLNYFIFTLVLSVQIVYSHTSINFKKGCNNEREKMY